MEPFEIKKVLETFTVIVDTREQQTQRYKERCATFDKWERRTLYYGDYAYNCILPNGQPLHSANEKTIAASCVLERKQSMDELACCLGRERGRFEREIQRARDNNARVFLLVENMTWEGLLYRRYKSKLHPNAFFSSLTAWMVRYHLNIVFCKAETSGKLIKEILYRDLKERLENGEFDERKGL